MIELRWVLKPNVIADMLAQPVKVLQYRERWYRLISKDKRGGSVTEEGPWSDWIDVPTIGL